MKKRKLLLAAPFVLLASGFLVVESAVTIVKAIKSNENVVLKDEYYVNDTVEVPSKEVDCNGTKKIGTITVKFPSGSVYSVQDSFVATEGGRYEIIYTAYDGGVEYSTSDFITAVRHATDLFTLGEGNLSESSITQGSYSYDDSYYGVKATITAGSSLYFNQIIDFNDLSMDNPLFSMLMEPKCSSGSECTEIDFVFTDVDNPDNYITMVYSAGEDYGYFRTGACGGDLKGWQNYNGSTPTSKCHTNQFGNPLFTSFDRDTCENDANLSPLKVFYEPETNQLYAANTRCFPWGTTPSFVIDYDDVATWGENIWSGFTNGRATLKITPKQCVTSTISMLFVSIGEYNLYEKRFADTEAPILTLDKIANGNYGPQAQIGEPYDIYGYSAFDAYDGELEATIEVKYVNPTNQARSDVQITNNTFTPNIPGVYEIIYTATDYSGNAETRTVSVVATNNITPLVLTLDDSDKTQEIFQDVDVLPASAVKVSGGSGETKVFRTIYGPDGRTISTDENYISLDDVGEYKIVYDAIDYLGHHGSKTITITSTKRNKPKIMGTFSFPDALLKGFTYDIPTLYAKECTDDGVVTSEAVVLINGEQCKDSSFVAEGETVRIQYVARGKSGSEERITKEYEIRDGEDGKKQDRYFLCEDAEVTLERNDIEYATYSDSNKTSFINKINSRSFTLIFNYNFSTFNASGVKVTLEDETRTKSYTMVISIGKTDCKMDYPGSITQATVATQYTDGNNKIRLSYNSAKGTITDIDSNVLCSVTKDDNGKPFTGFDGYVFLSLSIVEPDPILGSKILLEKLSNQTLGYRAKDSSRAEDTISPEIYLDHEFDRKQTIGSTFTVPKALSCDVLNPITEFKVDMYSRTDEGKVKEKILEGEDASVEHTIKLDTYDNFLIKYTSVDKAGNEVVATRLLYVIENQPPVLEANFSNIKSVYYVGDAIGLPSYKISDNSGHYQVNIYVIDPYSRMCLLQSDIDGVITSFLTDDAAVYNKDFYKDSKTWIAQTAGEYRFKVVAFDSTYNYSSSEYVFHVISK